MSGIKSEKTGQGFPAASVAVELFVFRFIRKVIDEGRNVDEDTIPAHLSHIDKVKDKVSISSAARWEYAKLRAPNHP